MIASKRLRHWFLRLIRPEMIIREKHDHFRALLRADAKALDLIAELDGHLFAYDPADMARIRMLSAALLEAVHRMVESLAGMNPLLAEQVHEAVTHIVSAADVPMRREPAQCAPPYVLDLRDAADLPFLAGGKASNLSLASRFGAPVPSGFVVTASAFARFLRDNDLEEEIENRFQSVSLTNFDAIVQATGELQELILGSNVPGDVADKILESVHGLDLRGARLAVRSSALAEDGRISFAGQYASELDVSPEDVLHAYKRVLAGKYCPRAVAYRLRHGLTDADTAMAVLVIPMIQTSAAGVVYTLDPACPAVGGEALGVYVVGGIGAKLVDGSVTPEKHFLTRDARPRIMQACRFDSLAILPDGVLEELGACCMGLERDFGQPQDVEWAYGPTGLTILQARPLRQGLDTDIFSEAEIGARETLVSGLQCAAPGAACGPVYHAPLGHSFRDIPAGAVVVTPTLRPALSQFLERIAAIVATSGSRASHLASVAREREIPVVVGCEPGSLRQGEIVTVDGGAGTIYAGCLAALTSRTPIRESLSDGMRARLSTLSERTVRLHLTDPSSPDFSAQGCVSLHDVVRFCHEQSVVEMFSLVSRDGRGLGRSRRLRTDLPLVMYVLDLGGGISSGVGGEGDVSQEQLCSRPMSALWSGMTNQGVVWDHEQLHVDWEAFDRISAGLFRLDSRILASYSLISQEYMHLNIRFGYHFSVVDALCGDVDGSNYIKFRFKGGGANMSQRGHRLVFLDHVLQLFGFETNITGDMLDASYVRMPAEATSRALEIVGLLLAVTRFMDIKLADQFLAEEEARAFMIRFFPEERL